MPRAQTHDGVSSYGRHQCATTHGRVLKGRCTINLKLRRLELDAPVVCLILS